MEWVAISSSNAWKWKVKVKPLSRVRLPATPWTTAYQAPLSMGFSRQEYWSGVPLPSLIYILLYITYITNKDVTFNTVNYTQYFVITNKEKESEKEYIYKHTYTWVQFSSVQSLSHVQLFVTPWTAVHQASPSITTPRVYSNSCPLHQWCHPTVSSSVVPFSSRLQSFPTSGSFPMSQFFASGGQSIGVSASASVLPMNIQDWSMVTNGQMFLVH